MNNILHVIRALANGYLYQSFHQCQKAVLELQKLDDRQYDTPTVLYLLGKAYYDVSNYKDVRSSYCVRMRCTRVKYGAFRLSSFSGGVFWLPHGSAKVYLCTRHVSGIWRKSESSICSHTWWKETGHIYTRHTLQLAIGANMHAEEMKPWNGSKRPWSWILRGHMVIIYLDTKRQRKEIGYEPKYILQIAWLLTNDHIWDGKHLKDRYFESWQV